MCCMYTVYSGMQEWVIQIPPIPILVSVLFPSLHLKYFRIKFLLLVSTGNPHPLVPKSFRRTIFKSLHHISHPGIRVTQKPVTARYVGLVSIRMSASGQELALNASNPRFSATPLHLSFRFQYQMHDLIEYTSTWSDPCHPVRDIPIC